MPIYNRHLTFPEEVKRQSDDIAQLKSPQHIGYDSIVVHTIQTGNTWDVSTTIPAFQDPIWRVTYIPDIPGRFYAEIGVDYDVRYVVNNNPEYNIRFWADHTDVTSLDRRSFLVTMILSFFEMNVNMRFQVRALSQGSISWERIQ